MKPRSVARARRSVLVGLVVALLAAGLTVMGAPAAGDGPRVRAGGVLRVTVPEAVGGKTVIGQLTVDRASQPGYVTAYACAEGIPRDTLGRVSRSDLNYDGRIAPVWSNRLIVQADAAGEICLYTLRAVDMIIDLNAVSFDSGITSFPNRRTDTRSGPTAQVRPGGVVRVTVPEAVGAKTVIGQLTADRATGRGYLTAYGCADGIPRDARGRVSRSDLNYDGRVSPVRSNRLVVQADAGGNVCITTSDAIDVIADVNGVADGGITSFPNRRTDTRNGSSPQVLGGGVVRVSVPEAVGAKTVIGQLTVDRVTRAGFVTAYPCSGGIPRDPDGTISRSDLNYDPLVAPVRSNRLIVQADAAGDICFYTLRPVDAIIDVNAVAGTGIMSFPNRRIDTRTGPPPPITLLPPGSAGVPVWPWYEPRPPLDGVAALTGTAVSAAVARRPILAVKIDNFRLARPQFALDRADAVIEENVEGVTRFIALFQTHLPSVVGPVRSARTADLDVLAGMNRPVFAYSGANQGVNDWIRSAESSGVLVDFTAQRKPCYSRVAGRPGPHNLVLDAPCAVEAAGGAGPAGPMWSIDANWVVPVGVATSADTTFQVPMDGVRVEWTWDSAAGRYLRSQDGQPHLAESGIRISARNVVEVFSHHVPSVVDSRSVHPITVGSGTGVVHRRGRAIPVTWSRPTSFDGFTFHAMSSGTGQGAASGVQVHLDRGTTFVHLVRDR